MFFAAEFRYVQTFFAPAAVRSASDTWAEASVLSHTCCGSGVISLNWLASIHWEL
jgi:hypothetical protein